MAENYTNLGEKLRRLLFNRNMRAADLAREINLPPPTIHRLLTGKSTRPHSSSIEPIAKYFGINLEELSDEQSEANFSQNSNKSVSLALKLRHELPLIAWEKLEKMEKKHEKVPFVGTIGEHAFATITSDSSMEPILAPGSLLIFDPERQAKDRNYILIHLAEGGSIVVRQLILDGSTRYLKSMNNDLYSSQIRLLTPEDKILGVLVECRTYFDAH